MNIIFTGVGGQGVILSGKILMNAAQAAGYDIKESEVHGMAQRGGTVECSVRYDRKVWSPLIPAGTADFIVSFELIEVLRKLDYLAADGRIIVNDLKVNPATVLSGAMEYPEGVENWLKQNIKNTEVIDTEPALKELGNRKPLNIIMLGALSKHLEFSDEQWHKAIAAHVKPSVLDMNLKAFALGRAL